MVYDFSYISYINSLHYPHPPSNLTVPKDLKTKQKHQPNKQNNPPASKVTFRLPGQSFFLSLSERWAWILSSRFCFYSVSNLIEKLPHHTKKTPHRDHHVDPIGYCFLTLEKSDCLAIWWHAWMSTWEQTRLKVNSTCSSPPPPAPTTFFFLNSSRTELFPTGQALILNPLPSPEVFWEISVGTFPWTCPCEIWQGWHWDFSSVVLFFFPLEIHTPHPLVNGSLNIEMPGKTKQNKIKRSLSKK